VQDLIRRRQRNSRAKQRRHEIAAEVTDPDFVFLHIAKAGGGSIRQFLAPIRGRWAGAGHQFDLDTVAEQWPDAPMFFFVRDPITRFVSGFNNYHRAVVHKGMKLPQDSHIVSYHLFPTANDLAEGLASDDEFTLSAAHYAITHLAFLARHLVHYLGPTENIDRHRDRIAYIGHFEQFDASVEAMREILDLPPYLELPEDEAKAHRSQASLPTYLSDTARAALRDWYAADIVVYEHCVNIHREQMAAIGRG